MSMAKEGRTLMSEAISDAKQLREASMEAAKMELIEQLTPAVREFIEGRFLGKSGSSTTKGRKSEDVDRIRRGIGDNAPGESHTGFEESKEKGDGKMASKGKEDTVDVDESLAGFFPAMSEEGDMGGDKDGLEAEGLGIPALGEGEDMDPSKDEGVYEKKDKGDEEVVDEEVEIDEATLLKIYNESLKTEATVTKSFGEMTKSGELDEVDPAAGIADVKKGEHVWEKETPPAKQDFTVKEVKSLIQRGMRENKVLRTRLGEARKLIEKLGVQLHEINLFNTKVLHVNRLLNRGRGLTREQRETVIESIDKATSVQEVRLVFESIVKTFKVLEGRIAGSLTEGRKPTANAQRFRPKSSPSPEVLRESADRDPNKARNERFRELAGLTG